MDDFLYNLRSGKLKQQAQRKLSHGDQCRGPMDRRKVGSNSIELINALKDVLQAVNETQNRIAGAHETLAKSEERQAKAIKNIADNLHRLFYQSPVKSCAPMIPGTLPAAKAAAAAEESLEAAGPSQSKAQDAKVNKLTARSKETVFNLIRGMYWEFFA